MKAKANAPSQAYGYWRGSPIYGGTGSGMGQATPGGTGTFTQGFGGGTGLVGDWHPTVLYMLVLIVAEMFVFGLIGRMLK